MDLLNFRTSFDRKDELWCQFSAFIETIVAFLLHHDETRSLIRWISDEKKSNQINDDEILKQLDANVEFRKIISKYYDEYYTGENVTVDFRKDHKKANEIFDDSKIRIDEKNWSEALNLISKAVRFCLPESDDNLLAKLYDKRSIVFYQLEKYPDCI
ncbi:hypothetical protein BLA29_011751, partial [Euroglyphus maynei]